MVIIEANQSNILSRIWLWQCDILWDLIALWHVIACGKINAASSRMEIQHGHWSETWHSTTLQCLSYTRHLFDPPPCPAVAPINVYCIFAWFLFHLIMTIGADFWKLLWMRIFFRFPSFFFLPSSCFSPLLFLPFIPTFPQMLGERLSYHSGSNRQNNIWCIWDRNLASGECNFSAFHEIVLAHKPERFDGANCKKRDANWYECIVPT